MTKRPLNQNKKQLTATAREYAAENNCKPKQARIEMGLAAIEEAKAQVAEERADGVDHYTVLNLGMGVDSTAILLRILDEGFEAFDINPEKFVVLTAQTGGEYEDLGTLLDEHIAPRLKAAGVRWVQVARSSEFPGSTIKFTLLSDTKLVDDYTAEIDGDYPLRDEYVSAGTIFQSGGDRLCSIKSKGYPLDSWLRNNIDGPYRQLIGFDANEVTRAYGDVHQGDDNRRPEYPLIEWGWDRAKCLDYIKAQTGACWTKSACYFCPYAGQGTEKKWVADKWKQYPELAADVMLIERTSQSLNETQTLLGGRGRGKKWDQGSTIKFAKANGLNDALAILDNKLEIMAWAVYEVRRVWNKNAIRSVNILRVGNRSECEGWVRELAAEHGVAAESFEVGHDITRAVVSSKPSDGKGTEHLFVAAPFTMTKNKTPDQNFDAKFTAAGGGTTNWGGSCCCEDE